VNRQNTTTANLELKKELKTYDILTVMGKRDAYIDLYMDYQDVNNKIIHMDTKEFNSTPKPRKRDISLNHVNQKNKVSPAIRSKIHSSLAATMVVLIGNVPWYLYMSNKSLDAWSPFFGSVELIGFTTTLLTWCIAEFDHMKRK